MSTYKEFLEHGDKQLLEKKNYSEAEILYNKAMKLQPSGIDAINALMVCKRLMKQEVDTTLLSKALKAIDNHPKHFLTLFNISLVYLERSDYENAHEYLTRAYKIQGNNLQLLYNLAFCKQELKEYKKAIELYDKVIEKDPDHHKAITHVAICHHYLGQTEEAANRIRK
jgi:tetratricopeptide (TPR) repeat protein